MINNYQIKMRLCKHHFLPEAFICLSEQCQHLPLLCSNCVSTSHQHLQSVYSLQEFQDQFQGKLFTLQNSYEANSALIDISMLIKRSKYDIEQMHIQLIQQLINRLSQEKKSIFKKYDMIEEEFKGEEQKEQQKIRQKKQLLIYLLPYAQNKHLLTFKLLTSNSWGISRMKDHLKTLQQLSKQVRNVDAINQNIQQAINTQSKQTFFQQLSRFLIHHHPLKINEPFQPPHSFRQKRLTIHSSRQASLSGKRNLSLQVIGRIPSSPSRT